MFRVVILLAIRDVILELIRPLELVFDWLLLVVSDVVMPNLDGPGMAVEMRKRMPGLPILFMSGYAEETLRQSISIDQVHFLPKPFSVAQIVDAVHGALASSVNPSEQG